MSQHPTKQHSIGGGTTCVTSDVLAHDRKTEGPLGKQVSQLAAPSRGMRPNLR